MKQSTILVKNPTSIWENSLKSTNAHPQEVPMPVGSCTHSCPHEQERLVAFPDRDSIPGHSLGRVGAGSAMMSTILTIGPSDVTDSTDLQACMLPLIP